MPASASASVSAPQSARRVIGRPWRPGESGGGSRLMAEKRAALLADLERELGGDLSPTDRMLLAQAADLLCRRPRSHDQAVRLTNAASRSIDRLRDKYRKPAPPTPSLQEIMAEAGE